MILVCVEKIRNKYKQPKFLYLTLSLHSFLEYLYFCNFVILLYKIIELEAVIRVKNSGRENIKVLLVLQN